MSSNSGKAVKAGIGYTIGNVLVKGIGFLTLPLFSRLLTTEEFGIFNVFVSYEAILYVVIGLALHSSIQSAKLEFQNRIDDYTSSISLIYIIDALIALTIALIFSGPLSKLMDFSRGTIIMLVLYSFGSAYLTLYNNRLSLNYDYKKYMIVALSNSLGNVVLSLLFILTIFRSDRATGRITGATVAMFVLAMVLLFVTFSKAKPKYNKEYWKFGIKYSLPIVPHGISQVLLAQVDRIMIRSMVGNSEAGIYSFAGNIKLIMTIINESATTAWRTWFFNEIDNDRIDNIQKYAGALATLFVIFTVGLMAISPEMILILGGKDYDAGKYVAIPMIIDAFVLFLYSIIVQSEYYKKKTTYIMLGTLIATVINLITNYVFIKQYGFIAAAYTTLFSYVCYLALHVVISYKVVGFFVLKLNHMFLDMAIVAVAAVIDLVFIESIFIRLGICLLMVAGVFYWLNRQVDVVTMIKAKRGKS